MKWLLLLALCSGFFLAGRSLGFSSGLDKYHDMCYTVGGVTIDDKGRAVECRPIGQLSEEEVKKFLTKL